VYVSLKVDNDHHSSIIKRLCQHPRCLAVYKVTGDQDIMSVMLFTDTSEYRVFADRYVKAAGVKSVTTQVVLSPYKGIIWSDA
jgi:DNA-binding Lrp family transcriptional regulator